LVEGDVNTAAVLEPHGHHAMTLINAMPHATQRIDDVSGTLPVRLVATDNHQTWLGRGIVPRCGGHDSIWLLRHKTCRHGR
jgi:hypothetical protein